MSKNTFEKAQESFKRYKRFNDPNNDNQYFLEQDDIPNIEKALELGKKQEKLLELYKGAFDKANNEILKYFIDEQDEETAFSNVIGALDDRETIKQIRELENEQ